MTHQEEFGHYLRGLRTEVFRESLRQFETRVGLSAGYIGKLELGQVGVPKRPTINKMAQALAIDEDLLLAKAGYAPNEKGDTTQFEFLIMKLQRIDPDIAQPTVEAFSAALDVLSIKYPHNRKI